MIDLISTAFSAFEQRMQSEQDCFPMERIYLDDLLPGEDSMQRSDLIAAPYALEPEKIIEEEENRKELYEGLRHISERERVYLLYRFGFEDDMEQPCTSILARAVQGQPKLWRWTISGLNCRGGISAFCCGGTWFLIYLCQGQHCFPLDALCQQGCFRPYWMTQNQKRALPSFGNLPHFLSL